VAFDAIFASGFSILGTRLALKDSIGAAVLEGNLTACCSTKNWLM
jgi:hypothetical protein